MPRSTGSVTCRCVSSPLAPFTPLRSRRAGRSTLCPGPRLTQALTPSLTLTNPVPNPNPNPKPKPKPKPNPYPNPYPNPGPYPNPTQVFSMGHPSGPDSSNGDLLGRGAPTDDEGEVDRRAARP